MKQTLTPDQIALEAYIAESNAEFERKARAAGATFIASLVTDALHFAEYGVYNIEQFKVWLAETEAAEAEKDERRNYLY